MGGRTHIYAHTHRRSYGPTSEGKKNIMEPNGGLDSNSEPPEFAQYSTCTWAVVVRSVLGVSFFSPKTVGG